MCLKRIGFGFIAASAMLGSASAQTAPAGEAVETVVVAAKRAAVEVQADRTVYSLDKNIQSASGSLSDVLANLPSVDVDIDGNVSLRGDGNVTILVDGKNSPLLAGSLADALRQIPADMIDRVEVITNPSAEFRSEGSGGVINIILRKDRELALSGLVRINVGNEGRVNGSASGKIKLGRVHLNASYGERRDSERNTGSNLRFDGTTPRSAQTSSGKTANSGRNVRLVSSVKLDSRNEIELGGSYNRSSGRGTSRDHNIAFSSNSDTIRTGLNAQMREGVQAMFGYTRTFDTEDELFDVDASHFIWWSRNTNDYVKADTDSGEQTYWQSRQSDTRETHSQIKARYTLPLPQKGKFKAGYDLRNDTDLTAKHGFWHDETASDWTVDDAYTNTFLVDRTVQAGYVSYSQRFGRFGASGGLRIEVDNLHTALRSTGETNDTYALGFYPSLYLSYNLSDAGRLRLSYSRRLNRPRANDLNPARYSSDEFNVRAGNPLLKPEQVDFFEASYRDMGDDFDVELSGFYRATYRGVTRVYRNLSDTVVLTTMDNLASRVTSGVEANLTISLLERLSLRGGGTAAYNMFDPGPQAVGSKQSGLNWMVRGGFDWRITADDVAQANAKYSARQYRDQGYSDPILSGNLGFKHTFGGGVSAMLSINNLFNSQSRFSVLDSPGLHQETRRNQLGRIYYLGLVYTFGETRDVDPPSGP